MNVIEYVRFVAMFIITGAWMRLIELNWGGTGGFRGDIAEGLGVIF